LAKKIFPERESLKVRFWYKADIGNE